ncbi:MAG: hypothetical protein Q9163_001098 [Psora crenata]
MDGEDQSVQNARVEKLWKVLDTAKEGQLSLNGLKKGLKKLDHPLGNADTLLHDVLRAVDTNRNGHIEYGEFRHFVQHTEKELWRLFKTIDRDRNGQLDKKELCAAFQAAGIYLPARKLDQFFTEVDSNHDGVITFDEWRNFLLFIPADARNLRAVLSYYSSTVTVNAEGDVHVSNDTVEGLGKHHFLQALFGNATRIFRPAQSSPLSPQPSVPPTSHQPLMQVLDKSNESSFPWDPGESRTDTNGSFKSVVVVQDQNASREGGLLTDILPDPGYFVAGGIAGVVSRTATAPLDRLKVYLIAQVAVKEDAVQAAKSGAPLKAAKTAARPLVEASKTLWQMGGIKSLFAGNGLNVLKVMPESAIKFGSYEGSKRAFARLEGHDEPKDLAPWSQFFAAGIGGIISQFCIYPLDTLKFRMQCETVKGGLHGNALILATARKMWKQGPRSFYRGLPMGLVGMFPYSAIDLTTFEYLKQFITARKASRLRCSSQDSNAAPGNFTTASIGAFSGAFGASVVYPINLLRTRLQSQGTAIHPPTYTGIWDVTVKTVKGEGVRGLFKGITPNLLKVVPAVSITYVIYDNTKAVLGLR